MSSPLEDAIKSLNDTLKSIKSSLFGQPAAGQGQPAPSTASLSVNYPTTMKMFGAGLIGLVPQLRSFGQSIYATSHMMELSRRAFRWGPSDADRERLEKLAAKEKERKFYYEDNLKQQKLYQKAYDKSVVDRDKKNSTYNSLVDRLKKIDAVVASRRATDQQKTAEFFAAKQAHDSYRANLGPTMTMQQSDQLARLKKTMDRAEAAMNTAFSRYTQSLNQQHAGQVKTGAALRDLFAATRNVSTNFRQVRAQQGNVAAARQAWRDAQNTAKAAGAAIEVSAAEMAAFVGTVATVGAAFVGIGLAGRKLSTELYEYAHSVNDDNSRLVGYNGRLALPFIQLGMGDLRRNFQMARDVEVSAARLARSVNKMEDQWYSFNRDAAESRNILAYTASRMSGGIGEALAPLSSEFKDMLKGIGLESKTSGGLESISYWAAKILAELTLIPTVIGGINGAIDMFNDIMAALGLGNKPAAAKPDPGPGLAPGNLMAMKLARPFLGPNGQPMQGFGVHHRKVKF